MLDEIRVEFLTGTSKPLVEKLNLGHEKVGKYYTICQ